MVFINGVYVGHITSFCLEPTEFGMVSLVMFVTPKGLVDWVILYALHVQVVCPD